MDVKLLLYLVARSLKVNLHLYQELIGKPVIPVGLLSSEKHEGRETTDGHGMKYW